MKNQILSLSLFAIIICLGLSSCGRSIYYQPPVFSDVGLEEKGELLVTASVDAGDYSKGLGKLVRDADFTVAYSPVNHLGAYINTYGAELGRDVRLVDGATQEVREEYSTRFQKRMYEGGLGYYTKLGRFNFETYAFHALGNLNFSRTTGEFINSNISKTGLKAALTISDGDFDVTLVHGRSLLNFNDISSFELADSFSRLSENADHTLSETSLIVKYRLPHGIKLKAQVGSVSNNTPGFDLSDSYLGAGVIMNFDELIKSKS